MGEPRRMLDLPLPPRQERFAQNLASGMTTIDAYIDAGYKPDRGNAVHLQQQDNVSQRVHRLLALRESNLRAANEHAVEAAGITKEWTLNMLRLNAERCAREVPVTDAEGNVIGMRVANAQGANTALMLIGKSMGLFIDRSEQNVTSIDSDIERMSPAERRVEAERLAREMGLTLDRVGSLALVGGKDGGNGADD